MSFGSTTTAKLGYALPSPPGDGVSDITFSPNGTLLTAGSWDNGVRPSTKINGLLSGCPNTNPPAHVSVLSTQQIIVLCWWGVLV